MDSLYMCNQGIMATQGPRDGDKNFNASWCPSQAGYWADDYAAVDALDDDANDDANDDDHNEMWFNISRLVFQDRIEEWRWKLSFMIKICSFMMKQKGQWCKFPPKNILRHAEQPDNNFIEIISIKLASLQDMLTITQQVTYQE